MVHTYLASSCTNRCSSCSSSCTTFGSERLPCKLNTPQEAESQWPCPRGSVHGQQSQAPHGRVKRAGHQPPPREHAQRRVCTVYSPTTQARSSAAGLLGLMWCKNRTSCHAWMDWPTTTTYQRRQARPWHRTKHRSQRHTAAWPVATQWVRNGICAATCQHQCPGVIAKLRIAPAVLRYASCCTRSQARGRSLPVTLPRQIQLNMTTPVFEATRQATNTRAEPG